ncbi:MAG: phosphate starvation-inducible protein PhoH, partial [Bacteroidetes bacterium QS_4_64_154]
DGEVIKPRSQNQEHLVQAAAANDVVFAIGPAGTGKTYVAVAMAVAALNNHEVNRIVLSRPAVEAGEELGFLPGDFYEKVAPYLRPLYDALGEMMPRDELAESLEQDRVEVVPLAYMRGRTLKSSFVILDEAQNATTGQMKMFLTRLGPRSRAIVTGDITQTDLQDRSASGLIQVQHILEGIDGIEFIYLEREDVARHRLVQDIIAAYEEHDE